MFSAASTRNCGPRAEQLWQVSEKSFSLRVQTKSRTRRSTMTSFHSGYFCVILIISMITLPMKIGAMEATSDVTQSSFSTNLSWSVQSSLSSSSSAVDFATKIRLQDANNEVISLESSERFELSSLSLMRVNNQHRQLEVGDFESLNQRWGTTLVLKLNDTTVQQSILGIPLILDIRNIVCRNLAIDDMDWEWMDISDTYDQQLPGTTNKPVVLISNFTITNFAIDCVVDYSFEYLLLGSSGQAELQSTKSDLKTSFTLTVQPPPFRESEFLFNTCQPSVRVDELNFIGDNPLNQVLDAVSFLLQGTVASQIESEMCNIVSELEQSFSSLLTNLTDTLVSNSSATSESGTKGPANTTADFLEYEQTMLTPDSVKLINFQDQNASGSGISALLDVFSRFSGISLFVTDDSSSNVNVNSSTWLDGLFQNGNNASENGSSITVDLSNNTLLNGDDGFLTSLTTPPNTSEGKLSSMFSNPNGSSNQSGIVYNFFGVKDLRVMNATLAGLSTDSKGAAKSLLSGFEGIKAIGKYTLAIALVLQNMQVDIDAELDRENVVVTENFVTRTTMSTDLVQMQFNTTELRFEAAILLAIDEVKLGSVRLGSLLNGQGAIVDCLLPTLHDDLQLTGFVVNSFGIDGASIDGLQSAGMDRIMTTAFEYFIAALDNSMEDIISTFVSGIDLKTILGGEQETDASSNSTCPEPVPGTSNIYVDFRELLLPPEEAIQYGGTGNEAYGNLTSGLVNDLLPALSSFSNFTIAGSLFNYSSQFKLGKLKNNFVEFSLSDFRFENNGLGNDSSILDIVPGQPYMLNNTLSLGNTTMRGQVVFGMEIGTRRFRNVFDMSIDFEAFKIILTVLAKVLEDRLLGFPIEDVFNLNCWLSMFPAPVLDDKGLRMNGSDTTLALQDLVVTLEGIFLDITCIDCVPTFQQATDLLRSNDYSQDIMSAIQRIVSIVLSGDPSVVQRELDRLLSNAPSRCPHRQEYDSSLEEPDLLQSLINTITAPASFVVSSSSSSQDTESENAGSFIVGVVVVGIVLLFIAFLSMWIARTIVRRRFREMLGTLDSDEILELAAAQVQDDKKQEELNVFSGSLYSHQAVPVIARYCVPLFLLAASALFWCGLFSPSMAVMIYVSIASNDPVLLLNLDFTLAGFTSDWWNSGAKALALVSVLSMLWPQLKIISTLAMWFTPTSLVSVRTRGLILHWFDVFGKWSVIVVFIIIVSTSVFQGTMTSNIFEIRFFYIPLFGVYAIILGQIFSEVTSKFVIHYHSCLINNFELSCDRIREQALETITSSDDSTMNRILHATVTRDMSQSSPVPLYTATFTRPHKEEGSKLRFRTSVQYGLNAVGLLVIVAIVLGCVLPSFAYDFLGLVGVLLNTGHTSDQSVGEVNLFVIVSKLMESSRVINEGSTFVGFGCLCLFLIFTVMVAPILEVGLLLAQWMYPMDPNLLMRFQIATINIETWQNAEVFFTAVLACGFQLSGISSFFAKVYCRTLTNLVRSLIYWGFIDESAGDQCIDIEATIMLSSLAFLAAVLALFLLRVFVKDAIEHRIKEENNRLIFAKSKKGGGSVTTSQRFLSEHIDKIRPTPVHFTDRFRWAMCSDPMPPMPVNSTQQCSRQQFESTKVVL